MNVYKFFSVLALMICLGACGGGGGSSTGAMPPTPATSNTVIAIGDSIGNGFGIATPWPDRLAGLISREVVNNSANSRQTETGVDIIQSMIDANRPTHVFILLGTNDAIRGSVATAVSNLQRMVDIANQNGVIAVVGTLPPITSIEGVPAPDANFRTTQINDGIRGLTGARLAPVRGMFPASLLSDGIHPGNDGQQVIADAFATQF